MKAQTTVKSRVVIVIFIAALLIGQSCSEKRQFTPQKSRTIKFEVPETVKLKDSSGEKLVKKFTKHEYRLLEPNVRVDRWSNKTPSDWSLNDVFRPRRHFGPFVQGSELENIQVYVNGNLNSNNTGFNQPTVDWFYNNFFNEVSDDASEVYRLYFRPDFTGSPSTGILPTAPTSAISYEPGGNLSANVGTYSANNLLFSLKEISYSSRYGGSLKLKMSLSDIPTPNNQNSSIEDFEYEFSSNEYRFDVNRMDMIIYLNPKANLFNPKNNYNYQVNTHVEIKASSYVAYQLPDVTPVDNSDSNDNLKMILGQFSEHIASKLGQTGPRPAASIFAHAWIHNQHQELIELNDKVTQIVISDDFSDIWTEQYEPYLWVVWQAYYIDNYYSANFAELRNEFEIDFKVHHVTESGRFEVFNKIVEVTESDENVLGTTRWYNITGMPEDICNSINHIELRSKIKEKDLIRDDNFETVYNDLFFRCNVINQQAQQQWYVGWVEGGIMNSTTRRDFEDNGIVKVYSDVAQGDDESALEYVWKFRVGIFAR